MATPPELAVDPQHRIIIGTTEYSSHLDWTQDLSYDGVMKIDSDDMARPSITVRIDQRLLDRLDRFAGKQSVRVSRTAVVEAALREFLDRRERKGKK